MPLLDRSTKVQDVRNGRLENIQLFCAGLFLWDFVLTVWFEAWLLRRKIEFRWSYVPYLLGRYAALVTVVLGLLSMNASELAAATMTVRVTPIIGGVVIGCASLNLMIRSLTLWAVYHPFKHRMVVYPVVLLTLIHWTILIGGVSAAVIGASSHGDQFVVGMSNLLLSVTYFSTVSYDLLALVLTLVSLAKSSTAHELPRLLLKQECIYFLIAFSANFIPSLMLVTNHRPLLSLMVVPSMIVSNVASSRIVTHLIEAYAFQTGETRQSRQMEKQEQGSRPQLTTHCASTNGALRIVSLSDAPLDGVLRRDSRLVNKESS